MSGKLVPTNGFFEFKEDVGFTSPSAAAQAVMGTSRNGRIDWVLESNGDTYARWQERQIARAQESLGASQVGEFAPPRVSS